MITDLRCAGLVARSSQKVRRLSENSDNPLTKANTHQVTIAESTVVV
jgi:hypothetical protein